MRTCGGCTACCTVMGVAELDKGPWTPCRHERPAVERPQHGGCAVYADRPASCREYACVWLLDPGEQLFRHMERPDRCGVLLDVSAPPVTERLGGQVMVAREVWPGAFSELAGRALLDRLQKRTRVLCLTQDGGQALIGRERLVRR